MLYFCDTYISYKEMQNTEVKNPNKKIMIKRTLPQRLTRGILYAIAVLSGIFQSCDDALPDSKSIAPETPITISGQITQENKTRANEQGFVTGDRMGIYIVDYSNGTPGTLDAKENRASNVLYTFDGDNYKWYTPAEIYWRDKTTPIDVYGYYPGVNYISDPKRYHLTVSEKQNLLPAEGEISNYETSDFLWGKTTNIKPTEDAIIVKYTHRMAGVCVTLIAGDGISDTEWEKLPKIVQVDNTVRSAIVDLATGIPVPEGNVDASIAMLPQSNDNYRAVVVPQTVAAGKSLLSITIDGITYSHKLTQDMEYQMGKMHNFTVTVNKTATTGEYEFLVTDGDISPWVNDETSHQFSTQAYVVIDCPKMGTLKDCITDAGYDYTTMQNLKVTGELTDADIYFLRDEMPALKHLNLQDVDLRHCVTGKHYFDDMLPHNAFYQNRSIRSIVLPSSLKRLGRESFKESQLMYSTLTIPEGVTFIDERAFEEVQYNGVELVLPQTLDSICSLAFNNCQYRCKFELSDNIKYMGTSMVCNNNGPGAPNFYGTFHLPTKLKEINPQIFCGLGSNGSFTGEIEIPQGITDIGTRAFNISFNNKVNMTLPAGLKNIGNSAFSGMCFNSLYFNNDLKNIGAGAFGGCEIPFQISLPDNLTYIGDGAFYWCHLEGELVIPEECLYIGSDAFFDNNLAKITLPSKLEFIKDKAFRSVGRITEITIPKYVERIGDEAFAYNRYLQTVVSLSPEPPVLGSNVFEGLYMDKVVLQVPEQSVELYRNADGWREFQNITAYRELAFNIPEIVCLDKGITRQGIIRTEGAWEIIECPSWVTVTPASGTGKKTELTVTVNEQAAGFATREGNIVFRLKDKDYTTYTTVRQVGCNVAEDEIIVLQEATAGASRAVPLFIIGDGYSADDIASGKYLEDMREQMEHFFSIEPLKSYRNYFTVSTAIAVSPESGIDGVTKFDTKDFGGDDNKVMDYARKYGIGIDGNEANSTVLVLLNTNMTSNKSSLHSNGLSISYIGKSTDIYPFDQQGNVLHYVVGRGFGKLAPESVNHFTFIKSCVCRDCNVTEEYYGYSEKGWWQNVALSSKMNDLPWKHLIFDERYSQYVDIYEGALNHSRGTYRSENKSVMGNQFIHYFNTISREILVRRIMECAGEAFTFEEFAAKDKIELPEE